MKVRKFLFLLILLMLFPFSVLALGGTTDKVQIGTQKVESFSVGSVNVTDVSLSTYYNYHNIGTGGYVFLANIYNYYSCDVEISWKLDFYNMNGVAIDTQEQAVKIPSNEAYALEIETPVYPKEKNYSVNDIRDYVFSISIISDLSVVNENTGNNGNYYIDKLNVVMDVDRSNRVDVDESFHVTFKKPIKFIERKIFVNNKVDGYVNNITTLESISTSEKNNVELRKGYQVITMSKTDDSRYEDMDDINIKYTRNMGEDSTKKKDIFYTYIVDPTIDVVKRNITFEIEFPELDGSEKIKFINGDKEIKVDYEIIGNKIVGSIDKLESTESLAILVDLRDGYFANTFSNYNFSLQLMMFGPTILLFIGMIITFLLRKQNKKVHEKTKIGDILSISPLSVGYIKKSAILAKDIATLIFELAIGGFIKIVKKGDSFELQKVKNYNDKGGTKSMLFEDIFRNSKVVTEEELYNNSYDSLKAIKKYLKSDAKSIENGYINKYSYLLIFAILSLLTIVYRSIVVFDHVSVVIGTIMAVICFALLLVIFFSNYNSLEKLLATICVMIFLGLGSYFYIMPAVLNHYVYTVAFVIGIIDIVIMLLVYFNLPKRSFYADKQLYKILKFEDLLRNGTMKQIEKALKTENLYFRLLPYVYALDCSDEWIKKGSAEEIPQWLVSDFIGSREAMKYLKEVHVRVSFALANNSKK